MYILAPRKFYDQVFVKLSNQIITSTSPAVIDLTISYKNVVNISLYYLALIFRQVVDRLYNIFTLSDAYTYANQLFSKKIVISYLKRYDFSTYKDLDKILNFPSSTISRLFLSVFSSLESLFTPSRYLQLCPLPIVLTRVNSSKLNRGDGKQVYRQYASYHS